jgi:chemotaxis protein MotB
VSEFVLEEDEKAGGAGWMATFADLMSLLMCFFVLLLSFSEMDVQKYKQIAGSMKEAFGVQNEVKVKDIPKGTSVIAQEFSSGRPDPTPMNKVQQQTADTTKMTLDVRSKPPGASESSSERFADQDAAEAVMREVLRRESEETAEMLTDALGKEITEGKIDVESGLSTVTIRIRERGSFPSGSATLNPEFLPVMATLRGVLKNVKGAIAIEGHTDDIPINTTRFRSNWDLSAERALSVAHELLKDEAIGAERFMVVGYAETHPLEANDNWQSRAKNRRVEIVIRRGLEDAADTDIEELTQDQPDLLKQLEVDEKKTVRERAPAADAAYEVRTP